MEHADYLTPKQNQKGKNQILSGYILDFRCLLETWIKTFYLRKSLWLIAKVHSLALTTNNHLLLDDRRKAEYFFPSRSVQEVAVVSFSCELCHLLWYTLSTDFKNHVGPKEDVGVQEEAVYCSVPLQQSTLENRQGIDAEWHQSAQFCLPRKAIIPWTPTCIKGAFSYWYCSI